MELGAVAKVELHCHLLGVVTPARLARIRSGGGTILVEPDALRSASPIVDVASFQRWFDVLKPYQAASADAMKPVLAAHVSDLVVQRVVYAEVMVSPAMFPSEPDELLTAFHRWREWAWELEQGRIQIEFVMVIPRTLADDLLSRDTQSLLALKRAGLIVGVALVGIETGASIRRFSRSFASWRDAGLGIEIHAGEHGQPEAVRDALEYGRPDRLGHGLAAFADAELIARIREENIHLEFCLTSNRRTGAWDHLDDHPARRARELGLSFSINTDNPGAFGCSMNSEFQLAADLWDFGPVEFEALFHQAWAARFHSGSRRGMSGLSTD
jgi:adenosine deaminase